MSRESKKPYANLPASRLWHPISWPFVPWDAELPERNETLTTDEGDELDALRDRYDQADVQARSRGNMGAQGQRVRALPLTPRREHSHTGSAEWCYEGYSLVVPSYHVWRCVTASSASHQAGQGGAQPPCQATMIVACYRMLRMTWPCPVCLSC
mgnify:CR=1 FL=1